MSVEKEEVPQLRFPDFSSNWKKQKIGKYIDVISGYAFKGEEISNNKSCRPILRGVNITEGYIRHNEDIDRFYCGSLNGLGKYILEEGDLVLGMDGSKVGKNIAFISNQDEGSILIQRVARLKPKNTSSIDFIYHHLYSFRFHRYVDVVNTSSGIPHISLKQIRGFQIFFPSNKEQQKIADFLSTVDQKIQQLRRKKELLVEYKKGVMQKLFSQEIRFKDENGKDFPDWENKSLGKLGSFSKGKGIAKKDIEEDGEYKCIRYGELYTLYNEMISDIYSKTDLPESKLVFSKSNDVLIPSSGETHIDIATASCVLEDGIALGGDINIFRTKQNGVFISYYLNNAYKQQIANLAQGNSVVHLFSKQLKILEISLPSKGEQNKIVDFLHFIDNKIGLVESKIEKFQTFKKGLLQQMFV